MRFFDEDIAQRFTVQLEGIGAIDVIANIGEVSGDRYTFSRKFEDEEDVKIIAIFDRPRAVLNEHASRKDE